MRKVILLAILPLALAMLSFADGCPEGRIVKLDNGNYIAEEPVVFSLADDMALEELMSINPRMEEGARGFFWSCYTKDECKFQHGRIWGGGCCTSGPASASPESIAIAESVRAEIDAIMERYM